MRYAFTSSWEQSQLTSFQDLEAFAQSLVEEEQDDPSVELHASPIAGKLFSVEAEPSKEVCV